MAGILDLVAPGLGPLFETINTVIDRLIPDKNAADKLKNEITLEVQQAALKGDLAQLDIDKAEAGSTSMFVAGARPAFMWLCIFTLGWYWLIAPFLTWGFAAFGLKDIVPPMPSLSTSDAQTALYGLLGLGAYRTADKIFAPPENQTKNIKTSM